MKSKQSTLISAAEMWKLFKKTLFRFNKESKTKTQQQQTDHLHIELLIETLHIKDWFI